MEGDDEFGDQLIIERVSNWYPLSLDLSLSAFSTSNAELSNSNAREDRFLRQTLSLSYSQNIGGQVFLDAGITQEMYRYDAFRGSDFDYLRGHAGLFYYLPSDDVPLSAVFGNGFLFAHYGYYRITDGLLGDEAFTNHSVMLGFQKALPIIKGHQVYYGISTDLSIEANNHAFQRHEHRAYVGYSVEWTEDLKTQVGYVASLFDYRNTRQADWNHTMDASVRFVVARPVFLGQECELYLNVNAILNMNDSNTSGLDYKFRNFGGGIGLRTSF